MSIQISKEKQPETFDENKRIAQSGGEVAGIARREAEKRTGKPVITAKTAIDFARLLEHGMETEAD
jgi:hypothetical protein